MTKRPDLALLNSVQLDRIRSDLRYFQAKNDWSDYITDFDIERLNTLALTIDPEHNPGRGHNCSWIWANGEVVIWGNADVYGGGNTVYSVAGNWLTLDDEEPEP